MEHLNFHEVVSNCSICCDSSIRKNTKRIHKIEKQHTKIPAIIHEVNEIYKDNIQKPKNKSSDTVYCYPYSSSSSESSISFIDKKKKKSITIHPSAKKGPDDEETTDSEFNTCDKFPITEKHYRHITDGVECTSRNKKPSSSSKKKPKEEKIKGTKKTDMDFSKSTSRPQCKQSKPSNSHACETKAQKKCNCKTKCKLKVEDEKSDSILSEKTFTKFVNSLQSYVNKSRKVSNYKYQRKILDSDSDSSRSSSEYEEKHIRKKKSNKEKEHVAKKNLQHHHKHHRII